MSYLKKLDLKEIDVEFYPNIVWRGNFQLNICGKLNDINQKFVVAKIRKNKITLNNLTYEEQTTIKSFKWFSLDEIIQSSDIIYPTVLPEYLPDILNGKFPQKAINIDLQK